MARADEVAIAKEWLADKHTTLWSIFDVSDDEGRERAAQWFVKEIVDLLEFKEARS